MVAAGHHLPISIPMGTQSYPGLELLYQEQAAAQDDAGGLPAARLGIARDNCEMLWTRAGRRLHGGWERVQSGLSVLPLHGQVHKFFCRFPLLHGTSQCVLGFSSGVGFASAAKLLPQGRWYM